MDYHLPAWQSGRRDIAAAREKQMAPDLLPYESVAVAVTTAQTRSMMVRSKAPCTRVYSICSSTYRTLHHDPTPDGA